MSQASQVRTYDRAESVVFLKTNERFGGLSNMAPGFPLRVNGIRIRTSEALYQACRFPHMPDVQHLIIEQTSPMTAKMRSKPYRKDSRPDWDSVRVKVMRWCLRVKLAQNWREFGRLLLATGERPIVEQSKKDDFWGAKVAEDGSLVGMNVLGRLLMELREQLKEDAEESLKVVTPLSIPRFLLLEREIEAVDASGGASLPTRAGVPEEVPDGLPQPSLFDQPAAARTTMDTLPNRMANRPLQDALSPYPTYRDSGLPWLGQVPEHWEVLRSGSIFHEVADVGHPDLELLSIKARVGIVRQSSTGRKVRASEDRSAYKKILPGYLGYNLMNAFFGGIGISQHEGILSPAYAVARPKIDIHPKFFHYLYQSPLYLTQFNRESYGIMYERNRLYFERFKRIPAPLPPKDEQIRIADFLDAHGRLASRLIRNKRRLIGLLNEQKQAIINQAVTRGLDPNAPMKATGIDWMPEVPTHWQTTHLGSKIKLINGYPFDSKLFSNDGKGHPLIRIRDIFREDTVVTYAGEFVEEAAIQTGDILVGMDGDFNVARWKGATALLNQRVCCIRPKEHLDEAYLAALLVFPLKRINDQTFSTTVKHLSSSDIKRLRFPVPPIEEQREISAWLSAETATLERTIDRVQREIQLVREYRERLIADVVTGKLDVRNVEITALPDEPQNDDMEELEEELDTDEEDSLEGDDAED